MTDRLQDMKLEEPLKAAQAMLINQEDNSDDEMSPPEQFHSVLAVVKKEEILSLALEVVQKKQPRQDLRLPVMNEPVYGFDNMLFVLMFEGGPKWAEAKLVSEVKTMRFLRDKTKIPIAEILAFSTTTSNEIGCPYILMEFVEGFRLYDIWFEKRFNHGVSDEDVRNHRTKALEDIAAAMIQLGKFTSQEPYIPGLNDEFVMQHAWPAGEFENVNLFTSQPELASNPLMLFRRISELGSFEEPDSQITPAMNSLVPHLLSLMPMLKVIDPFVLSHYRFSIHSFIVSDNGSLLSITGWHEAAYGPRYMGNLRCPAWLLEVEEQSDDENNKSKEEMESDNG
ncbi:hypothetical protein N7456_000231 [Penicillium angulare]|uniref:Aminoglycoside phosphotransferase domain-containing protein n=1 Tax=Penicillium angulare TaxID=116970 RepID=A0A9W9GD47_9EURO|nr:hypothetical protein N7456_000231 [Penicillium angulare]